MSVRSKPQPTEHCRRKTLTPTMPGAGGEALNHPLCVPVLRCEPGWLVDFHVEANVGARYAASRERLVYTLAMPAGSRNLDTRRVDMHHKHKAGIAGAHVGNVFTRCDRDSIGKPADCY